jgi:hypothetical protein
MSCNPVFGPAAAASLLVLLGCVDEAPATDGKVDRCTLLTDAEVQSVIGPHSGGKSELDNTWGLGACRWRSTSGPMPNDPAGRPQSVEVALFDEDFVENWARGEAEGEPVPGFVDGAVYDAAYGQLWFNCNGERYCVVSLETESSERRAESALRLARLVESRLR